MKSIILILVSITVAFQFLGCAHYHHVEDTSSQEEIKVAIGSKEIQENDFVEIFKRVCVQNKTRTRSGMIESCTAKKVGETKIIKVLTKTSALIRAPEGLVLESNMYVEKKKADK